MDVDIVDLLQRQLAAGQSLQESVSELAQADPKLAPIVQLLAQREQDAQHDLEQDEQQAELEQQEQEQELLEEQRRQGAVLREHLDDIIAELDTLRDRLGDLAGALGACPACFGEDRSCGWCRGRGVPGFMPPEPAGFDRLVMPALQLHARLHGRRTNEVDRSATQERSA